MSKDKEVLSEKLKAERHLLSTFKITLIIGLLVCGLLLFLITGYILRYYFLRYMPNFEFNLHEFIFSFAVMVLFIIAPFNGIIIIINCFMLRKLRKLKLSERRYAIPYISILINAIPTFVSLGIIAYFTRSY